MWNDQGHEDNPYLHDGYAPVLEESVAQEMEVIGEIPKDLNGAYYRNGPNPRFAPQGRYHWFDGDGMIHAIQFQDGKATYRNRWVRTGAFRKEEEAQDSLWTGIMENHDYQGEFPLKNTANTDVIFHNGKVLALWYLSGKPVVVDPFSLETEGVTGYNGVWRGCISAHSKTDANTGELLFFDYEQQPPYMTYGVIDAEGAVRHVTEIDLPGPRTPHDMGFTEHYSILMDLPFFASSEALKKGRWKAEFFQNQPSRFAIVPRYGTNDEVRWFEAEPCYVYHVINAWEEGDEIIMDACRCDNPFPVPHPDDNTPLRRMLSYLRLNANLHRWRFNLKTGETREGPLDDHNCEFPTIHNGFMGHKSRYSYNMLIDSTATLTFRGLLKHDSETGNSEVHEFDAGCFGSEAPFAPRIGGTGEDDGYLVSFVRDETNQRSEAQVFHAQALGDGPVARVCIPHFVPIGFHACWVPGEDLGTV